MNDPCGCVLALEHERCWCFVNEFIHGRQDGAAERFIGIVIRAPAVQLLHRQKHATKLALPSGKTVDITLVRWPYT